MQKQNPSQIIAKKQLGQVFLNDPNITNKIIKACQLSPDEVVVEIGAGLGVLTQELIKHTKQVIAIETDRTLCKKLNEDFGHTSAIIVTADVLKYNFKDLPPKAKKVIGNLPYYITTPIISKILNNKDQFQHLFCMVQWEYGQRLIAQPNTKEYGSFSCFVQYHTDVQMLFKIKNTSFQPIPKINSCFLQMDIHPKPRFEAFDEKLLFQIIRYAFQQRRKTVLNALSEIADKKNLKEIFHVLKISPKLRAENLSLENFVSIANILSVKTKNHD